MLDILFGWLKASKCKKLIRQVQCRLKFLKIKRESIIRQLRDDIAQLLKDGHIGSAFSRVEQLFKDQNLLAAYHLLDHFCEFIIINFPYIRKHKDCPNDINEAVSTLIYASAWCGDLPELRKIQKLFGERYGRKFVKAAVELYHGTLVNCQIREKLCIKSIPDNVKLRLMDEIAKDYSLQHLPKWYGTRDCQWEGFNVEEEAQLKNKGFSRVQMPVPNPAELIVKPLQLTTAKRRNLSAEFDCSYEPKTIPRLLLGRSSLESCDSNLNISTVSLGNMVVEIGCTKPDASAFHEKVVSSEEVKEFEYSSLPDSCDHEDKRTFLFNSSIFHLGGSYRFGGEGLLFLSGHGYGENDNDKTGSWSKCKFDFERRKSYCRCIFNNDLDANCSLERPCYFSINCSCSIGAHAYSSRTTLIASPEKFNAIATVDNSSEFKLNASAAHSHVHPKLPDYDELVAKFLALKKEHQRKSRHRKEERGEGEGGVAGGGACF